jgi:uncharacterized membrane protein YeiB
MSDNPSNATYFREEPNSTARSTTATQASVSLAPVETSLATAAPLKRIMGLDVTRGLAIIGMMAVHIYNNFNGNGSPTAAYAIAAGRSAATFVLMAGVSLALMTGGRNPVHGRDRAPAAAALAVRALMIGVIGFSLAYLNLAVTEILEYYFILFLLAIPFITLRPRALTALTVTIAVLMPAFTVLIWNHVPQVAFSTSPTFSALLHPYPTAVGLLITGEYPALAYLAYICAGLAIGRLNLSSPRIAARLIGGGVALALAAWFTSTLLLEHFGGLRALEAAGAADGAAGPAQVRDYLLWQPDQVSSWWWLGVRAPYVATPFNLLGTIGVAMALIGAMLLVTRTRVGATLLKPVAAVGSMSLTVYVVHLIYLSFDPLAAYNTQSYVIQVIAALIFATLWRRYLGQGPLERIIAVAARHARRAVAARGAAKADRQVQTT